jgi:hypothetical protein
VAASMMARFMPQTQFGVVAGQRVEGWAVGSAVDPVVIEAGAFGGVPPPAPASRSTCCRATAASEALLHAVTVPVRPPPATGVPGWHGPAFPKIPRRLRDCP